MRYSRAIQYNIKKETFVFQQWKYTSKYAIYLMQCNEWKNEWINERINEWNKSKTYWLYMNKCIILKVVGFSWALKGR